MRKKMCKDFFNDSNESKSNIIIIIAVTVGAQKCKSVQTSENWPTAMIFMTGQHLCIRMPIFEQKNLKFKYSLVIEKPFI